MIFYGIFHAGVNIDATHPRKQRYFACNRADGRTRTALGAAGSAGSGQRPAPSNTQHGMHRSRADQLDLRRLQWHTDQRVLRRWAVGVQIAHVTTIYKAVEACKDRGRLRSEERRVGKGVDLGGRRIIKKKKIATKRSGLAVA